MKAVIFTLFGATGDLAQKKIIPSLLALFHNNKLPTNFKIVAFSRRDWKDAEYRNFIKPYLEAKNIFTQEKIADFLEHIIYIRGTFDDSNSFNNLKKHLDFLEQKYNSSVIKIYHLAIQPEFYESTVKNLGAAGLGRDESRIIIEKPFGLNTQSASTLQHVLRENFPENNIYRIDHYLGKSGLLDIFALRKENKDFNQKYDSKNITSIRIRLFESLDIQGRGEFYNTVGALRDVGQNHVLEMLAVFCSDGSHTRSTILEALAVPGSDSEISKNIVFGQYDGYSSEQDIPPNSTTETYFKIKAQLQDDSWKHVNIWLEGGKAMAQKKTEIEVIFKDMTKKIFNIEQKIEQEVVAELSNPQKLSDSVSSLESRIPDPYEVLTFDAIVGDKTKFISIEEVIASWKFIDKILSYKNDIKLIKYKKGSTV